MLPDPDHRPARVLKNNISLTIPLDVSCKLGQPVVLVALRVGCVLGTAMPEAAVDEDGDLLPREHDVGAPASVSSERREIDTVAETLPMQQGTYRDLRFRVSASVRTHGASHAGAARPRRRIHAGLHRGFSGDGADISMLLPAHDRASHQIDDGLVGIIITSHPETDPSSRS